MRTLTLLVILAVPALARAGYEPPCHIDGCRSADGRFVVTAEPVGKVTNHGPNKWQFVWTDTKEKKTQRFDAKEVPGGQVFGHLFVAPDGETFALWTHVVLWTDGKSDMHGANKLWGEPGKAKDRADTHYSRRLVIYKKDGSVVKALGVNDFLTPDEWDNTLVVFNRIHWIVEYPGLRWKETPRHGYAFYRVSPDYTVLEFRVTPPRAVKDKSGRVVRVSLTDGTIVPPETKLEGDKLPGRPYRGPDHLPDREPATREGFVPSPDPVRVEGKVTYKAPLAAGNEPAFRSLFNGKDLRGWDAEAGLWRVKDGVIEGGHPDAGPVANSSWLILRDGDKDAIVKDFHFRCEFKMGEFNSGVQYRSTRLHPKGFSVGGYQADFLNGLGTGGLYHQSHSGPGVGVGESVIHEKGKGVVAGQVADTKWLYPRKYYAKDEWARCDVVCRGNHLTHFINGYPVVEYIDRDETTADRKRRNDDGVIALQIHGGKGTEMRVSFRELHLKTYADAFGDAVRVYNDTDLDGWKPPEGEKAWSAKPAARDPNGRLRAFGKLVCDGTGKQPLTLTTAHGPSFVFRCQVKTDAWKPGDKAPFKGADGWNLMEATVRDGKTRIEVNGEERTDVPPPVAGGKVALPGTVAAEYRNLVLIPIVQPK